jgi:RecA-family ATPase
VVSAASFAGTAAPSRLWHVPDLVPSGTVTLLSGDGGTGKSLVATQLGISSATGLPWLGHEVRKGPALYIGAEDDLDEMHRRVAAIAAHMDVGLDRLKDFHIMCLAGHDAILAAAHH